MRQPSFLIRVVITILIGCGSGVFAQDSGSVSAIDLAIESDFHQILESYVRLAPPPLEAGELDRWRTETERSLDSLLSRIDALIAKYKQFPDLLLLKAICHAGRASIYTDRRRVLDVEFAGLEPEQQSSAGDLAKRRAAAAEKVAAEYGAVNEALAAAIVGEGTLAGEREMALVRGVVAAQSAIVQERAIISSADAGQRSPLDPASIRKLLSDSSGLLREYVDKTPKDSGLEWLRGQYYYGVVQYRRSLKLPEPGQRSYTAVDEADPEAVKAFAATRAIFESIADPAAVRAILEPAGSGEQQAAAKRAFEESSFALRSKYSIDAVARFYAATANVYLGLMAAIDPAFSTRRVEAAAAARSYLDKALEFDNAPPSEGAAPISLSSGAIPLSHHKVTTELEQAAKAAPERQPLNDFRIQWGIGYSYDSNVTLLGRNTEAPLDKRRKRDSRFPAMVQLDYTADLDVLRPGDEALKKWQVFASVRAAPTWNLRIHDFNEQPYSASTNLRYELLGPGAVPGIDGLYLHGRYDYEYFLLGNDGFLRTNRVRPMLQAIAMDGLLDAQLYFTYEDRNYLEELYDEVHFDRDGNYIAGGLDLNFDLGKWVDADKIWGQQAWGPAAPDPDDPAHRRPLEARLGYEHTSNSTVGDEFDYSGPILKAGLTVPLPFGMDFSYNASLEWQDYWQGSRIDRGRRNREDFIQEHAFRLERTFFLTRYSTDFEYVNPLRPERLTMSVFGDLRFAIDDSNVRDRLGQSVFEYNRVVYAIGVRFGLN
ncbi:MAG: hypothetical protein HZB38_09285 [Planctomycetes bacterium]|nr:hypothetical protein [Planctomycetota bacterium]